MASERCAASLASLLCRQRDALRLRPRVAAIDADLLARLHQVQDDVPAPAADHHFPVNARLFFFSTSCYKVPCYSIEHERFSIPATSTVLD